MNIHHTISSSAHHSKTYSPLKQPWQRFHQHHQNCLKSRIAQFGCGSFSFPQQKSNIWKLSETKKKKKRFIIIRVRSKDEAAAVSKKGTIAGAVALIIGTSIGSGILALPQKTSPAGLLPSSISMTMCWAFLLVEALLLVEINVGLLKKKKKSKVEKDYDELEVISIRTMAEETLGEWGGSLATVTYVFLGYTSMIVYCSKSGEILHRLTDIPESISGIFFTFLFTILISLGGTRTTDQVNQWLTVSMIGLLIAIEIVAVHFGGWSGFEGGGGGDWGKVPATLPVLIFTLVYHDLAPVLCAYLEGDLKRIRASIFLGSLVPLLALLIWEAIALGLPNQENQVSDPVELLLSVRWDGVPFMVEAFSLLAVGTSLIGTLLSFSEFFKEQLNKIPIDSPSTQLLLVEEESKNSFNYDMNKWWHKNKGSITATAMVVAPSLFVSTTIPDSFSAATDIAGGYCMTMLYGVLPPAMAWATMKKNKMKKRGEKLVSISRTKPVIICMGLIACGIVGRSQAFGGPRRN
ncbi:hypothetical protein ABFS83_06G171000 [Erythranthe nasuta]